MVSADSTAKRAFPLLRHFSVASGVVVLVATAVLVTLWHRDAVDRAVTVTEQQNIHMTRVMMTALYARATAADDSPQTALVRMAQEQPTQFEALIRGIVLDTPVVKIKVFDKDRNVAYSPVAGEIGTAGSHLASVQSVFRTGEPASHQSRQPVFAGFAGALRDRDIVETYIPIKDATGKVCGVFEVYADLTPTMDLVRRTTGYVVGVALLIFGALYGVLFLIVRRAGAEMTGHYTALREKDAEIGRQTRRIESEAAGRVRAEVEVGEYALLLQRTLETIDHGICVYDGDLRLMAWNRKYIELAPHRPERVARGRTVYDMILDLARRGLFGPGDPAAIARERERRLFLQRRASVEERQRPDGRIVRIERTPMADGGYVSLFTDITERRAVERDLLAAKEAAEMASRAKSEFLANVSHELRTPLNSIIGFSQILQGDVRDEKRREYAADILHSGRHLLEVINDILDVSKIEAGEMELLLTDVGLREMFGECARMFQERARAALLTLDFAIDDGVATVRADELRLRQALINLISNAVKFTPAGGAIRVGARRGADGAVDVYVADTGIGIAAADIEKVLKPFSQVSDVHDRPHEGSGLGLYLVDSIVALHGGRLDLESEPGVGTTVTIVLPAAAA